MPVTIDGSNNAIPGGVAYGNTSNELDFSVAGSTGQVLVSNGASPPGWGTVPLATGVSGTLPIANGGTGTTSTTFVNLASNVTGTLPIANGGTGTTSTTFVNLASNVTGTLPVGNGGTGATTFTSNNVLLGNGASSFQTVAPGTSGNVLTSNGTTWTSAAAPGGGSLIYVSSATGSASATVNLTGMNSTYDTYMIVGSNVFLDAFGAFLGIRYIIGGSAQSSADYPYWRGLGENTTSTISVSRTLTSTLIQGPYMQSGSTANGTFVLYIGLPSSTSRYKLVTWHGSSSGADYGIGISWGGGTYRGSTGAVTGIQFLTDTAANISGTFRLYGIKNS